MREGRNREVKNVLGHLGLAVNRLIRVSFGPFQLGDLPEGAIAEVRTRHLREQLGDKLAAAARLDFAAPIVDRPVQHAPASPRYPEMRAQQASKGDGPDKQRHGGRSSSGVRARARPPQDDGDRVRAQRQQRRRDDERLGEPERARRERRRRRAFRGKKS
jgi:23S rRNA pseudouridine2605 synthase